MRSKTLAVFAALAAVAAAAPATAHAQAPTAPPPAPAVGTCVDVGPEYVLGQMVLDTYEICVPV